MASSRLPRHPDLDHLRSESRELQRRARAGDPAALAEVRAHSRRASASAEFLALTSAQTIVARRYGFASWARLRQHVEELRRLSRRPGELVAEASDPVDRFLGLACLTYDGDHRERLAEARALLDAHPEIATSSIHAMAAAGDVGAARALLASDRGAATAVGGPHRWEPLLYAAYSRLEPTPGRSTLEVARLLLATGADPNAGYLWDGEYPFTALTGAFGGGEDFANQPAHPEGLTLARLLLESGADPNDTQTVYNRMFLSDDDHLELLFEFGLGTGDGGPWAARLGAAATTIPMALAMTLRWAAGHGFDERVRLLLARGIDPDIECDHPVFEGRSPYELAERAGNRAIADMLLAAGAEHRPLDLVAQFAAACMRADRMAVEDALAADTTGDLVRQAEAAHEPLPRAAALGRADAVVLMLDVGFDVNARDTNKGHHTTALHEAATTGDLALVKVLLARGADPSIRDVTFDAMPMGWADHHGHAEVAAFLEPLTEQPTGR